MFTRAARSADAAASNESLFDGGDETAIVTGVVLRGVDASVGRGVGEVLFSGTGGTGIGAEVVVATVSAAESVEEISGERTIVGTLNVATVFENTAMTTPRASAATMPKYGAKRDIFIR